MGRACSTKWEKRTAYRILVGKLEGKRPLGRWVENIKINLRRQHGVVWTGSIWLRIGTSRGLLSTQ
jgi:hypothetical protein